MLRLTWFCWGVVAADTGVEVVVSASLAAATLQVVEVALLPSPGAAGAAAVLPGRCGCCRAGCVDGAVVVADVVLLLLLRSQ